MAETKNNPDESSGDRELRAAGKLANDAAEQNQALRRMISDAQPWAKAVKQNSEIAGAFARAIAPIRSMQESALRFENINRALGQLNNISIPTPVLSEEVLNTLRGPTFASEGLQEAIAGYLNSPAWQSVLRNWSEQQANFAQIYAALNSPSFAKSTQEYLATTEGLRYAANRNVWHYTSGWVLMQVLNQGHIWASSPQNLNDSSELTHGLEIIKDAFVNKQAELGESNASTSLLRRIRLAVEEILDDDFFRVVMNEVYYISASTEPDSLTLWRNYANGDGFAIGIDPTKELSAEGANFEKNGVKNVGQVPAISGWYKVHYKPNQKKKFASEFVQKAFVDIRNTSQNDKAELIHELRKHVLILASTMKHEAFRDEKEVRWMTTNWTPVDPVHYEHAGNAIVPVLYIRSVSEEDEKLPLPIRGVRCSPISPTGVSRTIEGLLVQRGYRQASKNVRRSTQPYKG